MKSAQIRVDRHDVCATAVRRLTGDEKHEAGSIPDPRYCPRRLVYTAHWTNR